MSNNKNSIKTSMIIAIMIIMSFSPIGYFKSFTIDISFMMIPVIISSIIINEKVGALTGFVFGLTSFFRAFGISGFSTTLFNINPFFTAILCFIPRILAGFFAGSTYNTIKNIDLNFRILISSIISSLSNTIFYTFTLFILFRNTDYIKNLVNDKNIFLFIISFVGINGIIEVIINSILCTIICKSLLIKKNL